MPREMKRLIIYDTVKDNTGIDPPSVQEKSTSIAIEPGNTGNMNNHPVILTILFQLSARW